MHNRSKGECFCVFAKLTFANVLLSTKININDNYNKFWVVILTWVPKTGLIKKRTKKIPVSQSIGNCKTVPDFKTHNFGILFSLRLNSHQSCPNNINRWGQTSNDWTKVLRRWEKIKYSNYFNSGLRRPLSRSLVRTPVLLILLSGTDSIVFFVSFKSFNRDSDLILYISQQQLRNASIVQPQVSMRGNQTEHRRNIKYEIL